MVGRSGAGKSTLARLAGRLADPDAGAVLLDGTDLRELTRASLRDGVVYAFERPELLGDTPQDVIGFGFRRPGEAQIRAAARQAQAAAFIARLPGQLRTRLDGTALSGGEVQRLGLARAFAHAGTARLLVLDDATSSLDTVTETLIARAITSGLSGLTRLIVAHRETTAARADLVAWLDGGRIRALAPHAELRADREYLAIFGAPGPAPDRAGDRVLTRHLRRHRRDVGWLAAWSLVQSLPALASGWSLAKADHRVPGRPHRTGPRLARPPRRGRASRGVRYQAGVLENRRDRRAVPR